jgi:hypothetical protein
VSIKPAVFTVVLAVSGACAAPDDIALTYDDTDYPQVSTAVVGPAPGNAGKVLITAAGGRTVTCGGLLSPAPCERVRLLPGTTILKLDYVPAAGEQLAPARNLDLPIAARSGHAYEIVASLERGNAADPGGRRVVLRLVDKGADRALPSNSR